jgi:hypothetical protein
MMIWKVEAELFRPVVAMDKAVEAVVVEVRLPGERLEGVVVAESRRRGRGPSDVLASDKCLVIGPPLVVAVGEVAAVVGESDDVGEPDVPSVEFLRRFARHSCNLPVYSRSYPPKNRET